MPSETVFRNIERGALLDAAHNARADGYRLVQISATSVGAPEGVPAPAAPAVADTPAGAEANTGMYEVNYTFARGYELVNYRLAVHPGQSLPSVSPVFQTAFLYENEMHDLFGITVENMTVNYRGMFYKLARRTPYAFPAGPAKGGK